MVGFSQLTGQVALVTGGGQGIGAGFAQRLRQAGAQVAVFDRDAEPAKQTADGLDGLAIAGDVPSEPDVTEAFRRTEAGLGPVSIVVNDAGITGRAEVSWKLAVEELRGVLDVNLVGNFLFSRVAIPSMMERGYGRIVNIASIAGKEGNPTLMAYSTSKAAVVGMTESLAKELVGQGDITVNAIAPAVIQTSLLDDLGRATVEYMVSKIPMGRTGTVDEVAALVHYLASREASFSTGQCHDISGGRATY